MSLRRYLNGWNLLCIVGLTLVGATSFAASWDCFRTAQFDGISLDKQLQPNVLQYTLTVNQNPTITIGSKTYAVNWIQAFYVVSGRSSGTFTAANGSSPKQWTWDTKASPAKIAGWTTQGNSRLEPGESETFTFGSFNPGSNPVVPAYHISYRVGNCTYTDWFKQASKAPSPNVPEPGAVVCLSAALGGLIVRIRRRPR